MASITLSAKETDMLVAVMSEMGEIPNTIDFEHVAKRVDVKYARNARQSFKKLFEKLKAQAGPSPDGEVSSTPPKAPSPTKRAVSRKKVGANHTPIKAVPKRRGKNPVAKKNVKEEDVNSDGVLDEQAFTDEDGKSPNHISSPTAEKTTGKDAGVTQAMEPCKVVQKSDEDARMSTDDEQLDAYQLDADEQLQADEYGMALQAYREWCGLNEYNNFMDDV
ncbi:hypothetical protein DID88_006035 [Monilinia fructigena]|uniref:Uncharacterized protein n=1 Tax=Monilinia fructigena TaxID=38457 RepID=A0A395J279_9HELO|nr:hypothetical protein DID88_006035 [Monilinia fructigena]